MENSLGVILFSDEVQPRGIAAVKEAAEQAGIPEEFVLPIQKRSTFIRALQELQREGILEEGINGLLRDRIVEDEVRIAFQFSRRYVAQERAEYLKEAVVSWDKETQMIRCEHSEVKKRVLELIDEVQTRYKTSDIQSLVKRYVNSKCKQVRLRDGVYFIPQQYLNIAGRVQEFFRILGFSFYTFEVNPQAFTEKTNIAKAIVRDMVDTINQVRKEADSLEGLSQKQAQNRLETLRKEAVRYRELAQSLTVDLDGLLKSAGEAGEVFRKVDDPMDLLVREIQSGNSVDPLVCSLVGKAEGFEIIASEENAEFDLEVEQKEDLVLDTK